MVSVDLLDEIQSGRSWEISVQVSPNGTSQICICGYPVPKDLSVRVHNCPRCGLVLGRDHVSAMLIENRYIDTDCVEFTPVEIKPLLCQ